MPRSKEEIRSNIREIKSRIQENDKRAHTSTPTFTGRPVPDTSEASFNYARALNTRNYRQIDSLRRELGENTPTDDDIRPVSSNEKSSDDDPWALPTIADWD